MWLRFPCPTHSPTKISAANQSKAARMANYTRYSPADWSSSNMSHFNSADNARNNSERIR